MESLYQDPKTYPDFSPRTQHDSQEVIAEDKEISPNKLVDGDQKSSEENQTGNSSATTVGFNIINTAIGGGILGYPYIMRQLGIVIGILLVVLAGVLTCFSVSILQKTKNLSKKGNYITIAESCFKKFGRILASIIIVINTLGGCIIYLVVFTTVVQNILEAFLPTCMPENGPVSFYCRQSVLTTFGALLVLPFNFAKDFGKLKAISFIKVGSVFIFTGITIGFGLYKATKGDLASDIEMFPNFDEPVAVIATIPQIIFGFNFLYNQFSLFKSMRNASDTKFNKTATLSILFIGLVYLGVGICGYLVYGSLTDNMLKNFTHKDLGSVWFTVLNVAFFICSLGGIPVIFIPARDILYNSITKRIEKIRSNDDYSRVTDEQSTINLPETTENTSQPPKNKKIFITIVLVSNVMIVLTAIVAPCLNQILGLIGSIGSAGLMFLFPMSFYLMLSHGKGKFRILAIIVFIFGVIIGISGFVTNLIKMTAESS